MPISKKNFIIDPVNNVTGQEFSFKNGQPTVKFSIPSVELMLETSNLRLSGQVYIKNATGSQITQSGYNTQLQVNENGTEQLMSDATKCNMQNFAGVHNLIKSIVIESKKAKIELVNDSIYPTHSALRQANRYGEDDFKRIPLTQSLASGIHADKLSRHLNIVGGSTAMPVSLRGNYFSIKLGEGLFEGYPLHLGREYLSGLNITIYLNNDSTSIFSRWNNPTSEDDSVENFSYVLKNLKLAGRYIQPTAQELKEYQSTILYNTPTEFLNSVYSSVNSMSQTPQLQLVQSVVNLFKRTDNNNNSFMNPLNFPTMPGLSKVTTSKNNQRFPLDYEQQITPSPSDFATPESLQFKILAYGTAGLTYNNMKALNNGKVPAKTSLSLKLAMENMEQEFATPQNNCFPDMAPIATDYSMGLGMFQNFVNQDYSIETDSLVATGSSKIPTATNEKILTAVSIINSLTELDMKTLQTVI